MSDAPTRLTSGDLPGLYQAAGQASLLGQKRYLAAARLRFVLIVLAAIGGVLVLKVDAIGLDIGAVLVVLALIIAVFVEIWLLTVNPEQAWYDGRALAESAKTLGWRYAVAGAPYGKDDDPADPERRVVDELGKLLQDAPATSIAPSAAPAISTAMRALRTASFADRKRVYVEDRIVDQQKWYSGKATYNQKRAYTWRLVVIAIELAGVIAALLRAFGVVEFDLTGVLSAMIGAGVGWLAIKQHDALGRAYTFAANELMIVKARLDRVSGEVQWADEVADAEEAISREHTMWRASRSSYRLSR